MTSLRSIVALAFGMAMLSGFDAGTNIERLDIPVAVRNGSGPIELVCVYNTSETENYGLVIKWYHDNEQIYQWIPPMNPQELGVIAGLTSYTPNITDRPQSHSIINVREVTMDMSGEYTCIVSTFYSEDISEIKRMIVYVPEESLTIRASDFNETHVNLSCSAIGARPRPNLIILADSIVVDNRAVTDDENYTDDPRIWLYRVTRKPMEPVVVECEIQIPGTGYGRRERLVYYPYEGRRSPTAEYMNEKCSYCTLNLGTSLRNYASRRINVRRQIVSVIMAEQDNLPVREKLVDTAVKFLQNPKVSNSPLKTKQEFLKRKGLTDDEIKKACELASVSINNDHNVLPVNNDYTSIPIPQGQIYPYYQQQVFRPTVFTRVKEFFNAAAFVGATAYCVYWFYKKFIEPFFFGRKKKETIQDSVMELDKTIQSTMKEMKASISNVESSVKLLTQNQSTDPTIPHLVQELKQDLASLKGLLLSRKQFPSAPPSIPAWQLDTSSQTHQGKTTEHEDDAHSGSSTNNSDSSLEMIREDPPKE